MTALFIGVVSHEGSRFAVSRGPSGLARQLVDPLARAGVEVDVVIRTDDLHDPSTLPISEATVQASLTEQLHLDREWAAYLDRPRGPSWWGTHALRWLHRTGQRVRSPGPGMVRRLVNIELSHVALLRAGVDGGADWLLILEDDAASADPEDCAAGLAGLMRDRAEAHQPAYVNVSESFTLSELGIEHLLTPVADTAWHGSIARTMLSANRPVTNTVCAILYRADFAGRLLDAMDQLPMEPVVPIDWKLNIALMGMFRDGQLREADCWVIDPAPIDQLSMRQAAGA